MKKEKSILSKLSKKVVVKSSFKPSKTTLTIKKKYNPELVGSLYFKNEKDGMFLEWYSIWDI